MAWLYSLDQECQSRFTLWAMYSSPILQEDPDQHKNNMMLTGYQKHTAFQLFNEAERGLQEN